MHEAWKACPLFRQNKGPLLHEPCPTCEAFEKCKAKRDALRIEQAKLARIEQ